MGNLLGKIFKNRLFKAGSLSLISVILVRAINFISIPVFSRLLTTAEYGNVDVFVNYANIFMFVMGLDTHAAISKAKLEFKQDSDEYMSSNILFTTGFAIIIIILINILFNWIQGLFGLDRLTVNIMLVYSYTLYVVLFRTSENNFDYEYKKNIIMNGTVAIFNVVLSVLLVLTVLNGNRQIGRILGMTIPTVVCAIIVYIFICNRGKWKVNKAYIKYAVKFGVPLIPHNLSLVLLSSADRIMIKTMISASAAGIYSLSYNLGMLLSVVTEGMNQFFSPWEFRKIDKGKIEDVRRGQRLYLMVFVIVAVLVMAIAPEIIKIIGSRDYWDGIRIVMWVVFAVFLNFTYTLYVNIEFFYLKSNWISTGTILAAVINCVLNFFFLKQYGFFFGAISTVISYGALLVFHMIIVNLILKKRYVDNKFVIIVVIIMLAITFGMNMLLSHILLRIICGIVLAGLTSVITYIIYKKQGAINFEDE